MLGNLSYCSGAVRQRVSDSDGSACTTDAKQNLIIC